MEVFKMIDIEIKSINDSTYVLYIDGEQYDWSSKVEDVYDAIDQFVENWDLDPNEFVITEN